MTYLIGMISQKGDVGKSTLANLFAREFTLNGFKVKIADLDTQQTTCADWAADRSEAKIKPEIQSQSFGNLKSALADSIQFDTYIFDGSPNSFTQSLEVTNAVDLIIIPTRQTKDDLNPAVKIANSLADSGVSEKKIIFALVKKTNSQTEIEAAKKYPEQTEHTTLLGFLCSDGYLPVSTAYGISYDLGKYERETSHRTLNEKAGNLAQAIVSILSTRTKETD